MRQRSNSGVRLEQHARLLEKTILVHQHPVTGLFPPTPSHKHAWIRDNVYITLSIWALALAYKKYAGYEDRMRGYFELEKSVVRAMRGLLQSMMGQREKLERFKRTQSPSDAIHAKFCVDTGFPAHGDREWGHLQIDAVSLYLLILAQITVSGITVVWTTDEVSFVQNLVFYIESAYRIPDYGIWERGDKMNNGVTELNASSIGMAKAALEAIDQVNLFGARGGPTSVIHALPDESQQCDAMLSNMLPRESNSKETDAALLMVIGYPAFAVSDVDVIDLTKTTIVSKLEGRYGFSRFLRDGFGTVLEDKNRLHYESWELKTFERIESDWPLFWAVMLLNGFFMEDASEVSKYWDLLANVLVSTPDGAVMPEIYVVQRENIEEEKKKPKTTARKATGKLPHLWGQSLFIVAGLLKERFISPGELDPLNRRLISAKNPDITVQVSVLAKNEAIRELLENSGFPVETVAEVALNTGVNVLSSQRLSDVYSHLGRNDRLSFTGRPTFSPLGLIATSKFYSVKSRLFAFSPQLLDHESFYLAADAPLCVDSFLSKIDQLALEWGTRVGRPTIVFVVDEMMIQPKEEDGERRSPGSSDFDPSLDFVLHPLLIATMRKLRAGFVSRARVHLDQVAAFLSTACVTTCTFLYDSSDPSRDVEEEVLADLLKGTQDIQPILHLPSAELSRRCSTDENLESDPSSRLAPELNLAGIIKKNRSSNWTRNTLVVASLSSVQTGLVYSAPPPDVFVQDLDGAISRLDSVVGGGDRRSARQSSPLSIAIPPSGVAQSSSFPSLASPRFSANLVEPSSESLLSQSPSTKRHYERRNVEIEHQFTEAEVVRAVMETNDVTQQAEYLHYLAVTKGLEWRTGESSVSVQDLLGELYERACGLNLWWLVRHTSGLLRKRAEDLGRCVSSIVVRQKQVTVGYSRDFDQPHVENAGFGVERLITRPLPPNEILNLIYAACGGDFSLASLTQEILIFLAVHIETQPKLFVQMLRIRIGLIIQTMVAELAVALSHNDALSPRGSRETLTEVLPAQSSEEEALEHLLNLSPLEVKTLLFYVLSGKEFGVSARLSDRHSLSSHEIVSIMAPMQAKKAAATNLTKKLSRRGSQAHLRVSGAPTPSGSSTAASSPRAPPSVTEGFFPGEGDEEAVDALDMLDDGDAKRDDVFNEEDDDDDDYRFGFWLRRRRIDGALNRVPVGFYERIWRLLDDRLRGPKGLAMMGNVIDCGLTQEMTESEMNFALAVEERLNQIPQPEFRQLIVEALMIISSVVENVPRSVPNSLVGAVVNVDQFIHKANAIFLEEQKPPPGSFYLMEDAICGVSRFFYDQAPSGQFGTMTYLTRAAVQLLRLPRDMDCALQ